MHQTHPQRAEFSASLIQLSRAWRRRLDETASPFGLTEASAFPLIHILRAGGGARQHAVAEAIGIEGPSLVRLLDQLCATGLVERREDPDDRRAKTLHLTARGEALATELEQVMLGMRAALLNNVSAEDLEACLRVFRTVRRNLAPSP